MRIQSKTVQTAGVVVLLVWFGWNMGLMTWFSGKAPGSGEYAMGKPYKPPPGSTEAGTPIQQGTNNELIKVTREELGHGVWVMLHTLAANYPDDPDSEEVAKMVDFIYLVGEMFPCGTCRDHFQEMLARTPPEAESRELLVNWFYDRHQEVRVRTHPGVPAFPKDQLDARYQVDGFSTLRESE